MSYKRLHYKIIEIKEEYEEALSIITVTKVRALAKNMITEKEEEILITFLQLIDYYDMQKRKEVTGTVSGGGSKVTIEVI